MASFRDSYSIDFYQRKNQGIITKIEAKKNDNFTGNKWHQSFFGFCAFYTTLSFLINIDKIDIKYSL